MSEYLSVTDASNYLNVKKSFLYSMVQSGQIPHYRFGRMIRFKHSDLDTWIEDHRKEKIGVSLRAGEILRKPDRNNLNPDDVRGIIKKSVASVTAKGYNLSHGKPDQDKDLRKEVSSGTL